MIRRVVRGLLVVLSVLLGLALIGALYGTSSVGEATVAIGTLALALATVGLALATIGLAATTDEEMRLLREQTAALKTQADTVRTQADVARNEAEARTRELHRAQAELIGAAMGPRERAANANDHTTGRTGIDLFNTSPSPVYGLVVAIVDIQGTAPRTIEEWLRWRAKDAKPMPITTANILPPGTFRVWVSGVGWQAPMGGRSVAEVAFTDRAGNHWIRRASGKLEELTEPPLEYFKQFGLYGPYDFTTPERL